MFHITDTDYFDALEDSTPNVSNISFVCGIDTEQINSPRYRQETKEELPFLTKKEFLQEYGTTLYVINTDRAKGNHINHYYEFIFYRDFIIHEALELDTPKISRCDIRFDSYVVDFKTTLKMARFLMRCMSLDEDIDRFVTRTDEYTLDNISVWAAGGEYEIEVYNKQLQLKTERRDSLDYSLDCDVLCRIEFRRKRLYRKEQTKDIERECFKEWIDKINKAIRPENIRKAMSNLNYRLWEKYDEARKAHNVTLREFIVSYMEYFFTSHQLRDFISGTGESSNPSSYANRIARDKNIELFSHGNLIAFANKIKVSGNEYFSS